MTVGHNSVAAVQLRSIIERVEKLSEDRDAIAADIRDVYAEARGAGFDQKALRTIVKLRKQDAAERDEHEAVVDTYRRALNMIPELEEEDAA